jgi:hypothetical protein
MIERSRETFSDTYSISPTDLICREHLATHSPLKEPTGVKDQPKPRITTPTLTLLTIETQLR